MASNTSLDVVCSAVNSLAAWLASQTTAPLMTLVEFRLFLVPAVALFLALLATAWEHLFKALVPAAMLALVCAQCTTAREVQGILALLWTLQVPLLRQVDV